MSCKRCHGTGLDRANYDGDTGASKCLHCGTIGSFAHGSAAESAIMEHQRDMDREYQRELREERERATR